METNKNIMPIIGLGNNLFGFIKGDDFFFCDERGNIIEKKISDFVFFAVREHYYSKTISPNDDTVILIDKNLNYVEYNIANQKMVFNDLYVFRSFPVYIENYKQEPFLFHPYQYINFEHLNYCFVKNKNSIEFVNNLYYVFSLLDSYHFFVEIKDVESEVDTFKYILYDNYGNIIKTWNDIEQIKCIWCRKNGSYTIISTNQKCTYDDYNYCYGIIDVNKHITLLDSNDENNCDLHLFTIDKEDKLIDEKEIIEGEEIIDKKDEYFPELTISISKEYLSGFEFVEKDMEMYNDKNLAFNKRERLFCDNDYLIAWSNTGFLVFSHTSLITKTDLSKEIYDILNLGGNACAEVEIIPNYSNRIISYYLRQTIVYKQYYNPWGEEDYVKERIEKVYDKQGNYIGKWQHEYDMSTFTSTTKIYDIFGCYVGEYFGNDGIFRIPAYRLNNVVVYSYGVIQQGFPPIIPPIFSKIETFDYFLNQTSHLYITSLELSRGGRVLKGIFNNEEELIKIGNNEIIKVSDNYVLVKNLDLNEIDYTLYHKSGEEIGRHILKMDLCSIYDIREKDDGVAIRRYGELRSPTYAIVYKGGKQQILYNDKYITNELFVEVIPIRYDVDDVYFYVTRLNGYFGIISLKIGWILESHLGKCISKIDFLSGKDLDNDDFGKKNYYHISHILKTGEPFSRDDIWELRHSVNCSIHATSLEHTKLVQYGNRYRIINTERMNEKEKADLNIIDGILFFEEGDMSIVHEKDLFCKITCDDGNVGFFSIKYGWIIEPMSLISIIQFKKYVIFNNKYVISNLGKTIYVNDNIEIITTNNEVTACYIKDLDNYIIIDEDGWVYNKLYQIDQNKYVNKLLDDCHVKYQIVLDVASKTLSWVYNDNYKSYNEDNYYERGHDWTNEDAWDAMTDGQYGDYPGSGWDMEMFGH